MSTRSILSRVQRYSEEPLSAEPERIGLLRELATKLLGTTPFDFQLDAANSILEGHDTVLDVATGSGKTLCFMLPLLPNLASTDPRTAKKEVVLVVSPLSALMMDQAANAYPNVPTIAVCAETIKATGMDKLYSDITALKYRVVIVSPEIATSQQFREGVLSKAAFRENLRSVCVDEAHCVSLWGGSFRKDYKEIGLLRGRVPSNVPFLVASATLPDHVLDDVRSLLQISPSANLVRLSNERPNVALSVRAMRHSKESMADLAFLIPKDAQTPEDIPLTIVYVNTRAAAETGADKLRNWLPTGMAKDPTVAFYHAQIGVGRKRDLEQKLRDGTVRILFATDAVSMGFDVRAVVRVILWGFPPSFCSLAQRAGRAVRDLTMLGEAILIVSKQATETAIEVGEVEALLQTVAEENEASNMDEHRAVQAEEDHEMAIDTETGVRAEQDTEYEDGEELDDEPHAPSLNKADPSGDRNRREAIFLSKFASAKCICRRKVWNTFFGNQLKGQLRYPKNTLYTPIAGARCCDLCMPDSFPVEHIELLQPPRLRMGPREKFHASLQGYLREALVAWRDSELMEMRYPAGQSIISAEALFPDDILNRVIDCGVRLETGSIFREYVRWPLGFTSEDSNELSREGTTLLACLKIQYDRHDAELYARPFVIHEAYTAEHFYGAGAASTSRGRRRRGSEAFADEDDGSSEGSDFVPTDSRGRGRGRSRGRARASRGQDSGQRSQPRGRGQRGIGTAAGRSSDAGGRRARGRPRRRAQS